MYASNSAESDDLVIASFPVDPVYEEVWRHLPDAFIALDTRWRVIYFNKRAETLLGCNLSQVLGQCFWEQFPNLASPAFRNACERAMLHLTDVYIEQASSTGGMVLDIHTHPSKFGVSIHLRDATERKQAEADRLEQTTLSDLIATLNEHLKQQGSMPEILDQVAQAILQSLESIVMLRIWRWNPEHHWLELQTSAGLVNSDIGLPHRISLGISIIGLIAQNRQPYLTNDVSRDICLRTTNWSQHENIVAFAGYPLVVEDKLIGVMALFSRQPFSTATHKTLPWIVTSIAITIDRALAKAELLSRRESLLFRLANHIRNSLDLDHILGTAVQEIRRLFQIDRCQFIWCWSNSSAAAPQAIVEPILCISHEAKHPDQPSLLGECSPEQVTILSTKILNLQASQVEDVFQDAGSDSDLAQLMQDWGMVSYVLMPLETRSGHLGAIVCGHCQGVRPWSESEVELLQAVTDQLAIAIDQAELYAQTRAAALAAQTQAEQLTEALKHLRQTQTQLIQSEKMSSLGQLVAGIAHEINNPVTFVSGNLVHANQYFRDLIELLELYQKHYPAPAEAIQTCIEDIDLNFLIDDLDNVLNSMRIGADRIYKIVLSLRNFSRLDEAEVKAVDLHEGIDSTLLILQNRLKPRGQRAGIEVIKQYGVLPQVNCYASQLNQAFMNLLNNAIDALDECPSSPTITIQTDYQSHFPDEASAHPNQPSWVIIKIRDNGMGMSEDVTQRIFDPFYTTKPVGQGTGLGLSISHQIVVERHKGRLSCQSTPGEGTEFTIAIPFYNVSAVTENECDHVVENRS